MLVTGANGGVGRFQVQLAVASGATVTAYSAQAGAQAGSQAQTQDGAQEFGPFDVVLESVGGATLTAALAAIAPGGTIVVLGTSSGEKTPIDIYDFIGHEGARLISYLSYAQPDAIGQDLQTLVDLVAAGRLHTTLSHVADWSDLVPVLDDFRARRLPGGKAVLTIGGPSEIRGRTAA
ncbi:zinc-binding dehydrogenase [Catenulispora yoronensis]